MNINPDTIPTIVKLLDAVFYCGVALFLAWLLGSAIVHRFNRRNRR